MSINDYNYKMLIKKDVYKKIGKNIQKARKAKGLTQEEFAELMDKSWSYIAKLETGTQNFSIGKLIDIAGFLEIDFEELIKIKDK